MNSEQEWWLHCQRQRTWRSRESVHFDSVQWRQSVQHKHQGQRGWPGGFRKREIWWKCKIQKGIKFWQYWKSNPTLFQIYSSIEDMVNSHKSEALKLTSASQKFPSDSNTTLNCWPTWLFIDNKASSQKRIWPNPPSPFPKIKSPWNKDFEMPEGPTYLMY